MNRRLSILVAAVAVGSLGTSLTSCNSPSCGAGTVQMQQSDGTLKCVPTDVPAALTPCDTDGGNVTIVGGKCVSAIQCDPGTTMNENGICVGTGGGPTGCSTPSPGKACVPGSIFNFTDNKLNKVTPIHVALYNPTDFLGGMPALAEYDVTTGGDSYVFQNFTPPGLTLIVIVTSTATGGTQFTVAATGDQGVSPGSIYHVDAYAVKKSDSDGWGFDISRRVASSPSSTTTPSRPRTCSSPTSRIPSPA